MSSTPHLAVYVYMYIYKKPIVSHLKPPPPLPSPVPVHPCVLQSYLLSVCFSLSYCYFLLFIVNLWFAARGFDLIFLSNLWQPSCRDLEYLLWAINGVFN